MEIEIKGENDDLKVIDYVVRNIDWEDGETTIKKPHFQARFQLKDSGRSYQCDISYFDKHDKFVGLDDPYTSLLSNDQNMPSTFSTALNIPEEAIKVVLTFTPEKEDNLVQYAIGIAIIFGLMLLGTWAIKSVLSLFSL